MVQPVSADRICARPLKLAESASILKAVLSAIHPHGLGGDRFELRQTFMGIDFMIFF
jgi:hypothetical protein